MIVCVCNQVSDRDITRQVHAGLDFSDIQLELGVATQCGQCEGCARDLVERCASEGRPAAVVAMAALPRPSNPVEQPLWFFSPASA